MNRLTTLLLAFVLLLPSVALAQFDPTTHDHLLYYVPFQALNGAAYTQGVSNDGAVADEAGELVGSIATGIGGVTINAASAAPSTERRVPLAAVGGTLGMVGTTDRGVRHNSTSYANTIHQNRKVWVIAFYSNAASATSTRSLIESTNLANPDATSAQGFSVRSQQFTNTSSVGGIYRKKTGAVMRLLVKNTTATPIVDLVTEEDLDAASEALHCFEAYVTPDGLSKARVDDGRITYNLVQGDAGTGNAAFAMFFTNRASFSTQFQGTLIAAGVYSDYPGDAARQEWLDAAAQVLGTYKTLSGSSEIRVANHHINFSRDQAGMPYCHWWESKRISGQARSSGNEEGGNVVFGDGVSTDYLGSVSNWVGGPHRNETLDSATVSIDGAAHTAYATGNIYQGNGSVQIIRNTTMGISFDQVETMTLTRNALRVNTVLTRLNDARTVNPLYFRTSRDTYFEDFLAFDATGATIHDSSVTAAEFECDPGVIAIAQWNPNTLTMALTTVMKGRELDFTTLIFYSANSSRRIYHRLNSGDIPTGTASVEFEVLSKFYTTTAEAWKALAASELAAILAPPKGRGGIGLGIGIGLGSVERKSPAEEFLAAARANQFSLAP